jgi:hypothetical protein
VAGVPAPAEGGATAPVCDAAAAAMRCVAGELCEARAGALTTTAFEAAPSPTAGQPLNDTTALASTNRMAAPASSDPAVPKPAMYARVARTFVTYRHLPWILERLSEGRRRPR